jgi:hypothetical protein
VASESAFSLAGMVVDKNSCSLLPKTVEALMCTQDWLRDAIPGIQFHSMHCLKYTRLMKTVAACF